MAISVPASALARLSPSVAERGGQEDEAMRFKIQRSAFNPHYVRVASFTDAGEPLDTQYVCVDGQHPMVPGKAKRVGSKSAAPKARHLVVGAMAASAAAHLAAAAVTHVMAACSGLLR